MTITGDKVTTMVDTKGKNPDEMITMHFNEIHHFSFTHALSDGFNAFVRFPFFLLPNEIDLKESAQAKIIMIYVRFAFFVEIHFILLDSSVWPIERKNPIKAQYVLNVIDTVDGYASKISYKALHVSRSNQWFYANEAIGMQSFAYKANRDL